MELIVIWLGGALLIGAAARSRGRSFGGWFIIAVLVSPLLGALALLLLPSRTTGPGGERAPTPDTHVRCPDCRELVRRDARKCKHCGTPLVPQ